MLGPAAATAVCQQRGLQLENCFNFSYSIKCSVYTGDSIVVHYGVGSTNIIIQTFFNDLSARRYSIDFSILRFVYARNWKLFICDCSDLHLRVFNHHFELIQAIPLSRTILSIAYNETTNEIYTGSIGSINCWDLCHKLQEPLKASVPMTCDISKKEWVISLYLSTHSSLLVAGCQNGVYMIDCKTHAQVNYQANIHKASISCAVLYYPSQYLITAAMDGTIKVSSSVLNTEFVMSMKPMGHLQEITGLGIHPDHPFLISTSVDGNIRVWDLKSFSEYCSWHFTSPILALAVTPTGNVISSCRNEICSFKLNRVEVFLSSLHSEVESISTVKERNQSALVMTEDGSARLLSTVSGLCISIMFPLYTPSLVKDIVRNVSDNLLCVLTNTGEIIIFTASTNPCSAKQLWYPLNSEEHVTCITMIQDDSHAVLVGGHESGSLSILYNGGYSIPLPYYAHGRPIKQLVSSQQFIESTANEMRATLATFTVEEPVQIWLLKIRTDFRDGCCLQKIMSLSISFDPVFMGTTDSCLAFTTPSNGVCTFNIPVGNSNTQIMCIEPNLATNQPEDLHLGHITSFSMHQTLNLFATCSEDGRIKVWDHSCDLVAEVNMGSTVNGICFITRGADLLIGFNEQLSIIKGRTLLPQAYLSKLRKEPDVVEIPITFDHYLEFWYDQKRVPTFPLSETGLFNLRNDARRLLTPVQQQQLANEGAELLEWVNSSDKVELNGGMMMLPKLLQEGSEKMSLDEIPARQIPFSQCYYTRRMRRFSLIKQQDQEPELSAALEDGKFYSEQITVNGILINAPSSGLADHKDHLIPLIGVYSPSKVSLRPLLNQAPNLPIAPDGLLPNSVIREHYRPVLADFVHTSIKNKMNVEERILRKLMSKVRLSRMRPWFTDSVEEDTPSLVFSPKNRKFNWDWDDDEDISSSGDDQRVWRRNKKTKKKPDPLQEITDFSPSYKNSMGTSDMMESAYVFRNRRARNRSKLGSIGTPNDDVVESGGAGPRKRMLNPLPIIEDSSESFTSSTQSIPDTLARPPPSPDFLTKQSKVKLNRGRNRGRGKSPTPRSLTPSPLVTSPSPVPPSKNAKSNVKFKMAPDEKEKRAFPKRVKSSFKYESTRRARGAQLSDSEDGDDSEVGDSHESGDDGIVGNDALVIDTEDSFFDFMDDDITLEGADILNFIDQTREMLLRERSIDAIPGVLSADEAVIFIRKETVEESPPPPRPYKSSPNLTRNSTSNDVIVPVKKKTPFVPNVPLKLWNNSSSSTANERVQHVSHRRKSSTHQHHNKQAASGTHKHDSHKRHHKKHHTSYKNKDKLEALLDEITMSPWYTDMVESSSESMEQHHKRKDHHKHKDHHRKHKDHQDHMENQDFQEHEQEDEEYREHQEHKEYVKHQWKHRDYDEQLHHHKQRKEPSLETVQPKLVDILERAQSSMFDKVCKAIEDLHALDCLSVTHIVRFAIGASTRLEGGEKKGSSSIKLDALKLLEQLHVRAPAVIKAIIPLLTSKNEEIREAAFTALNTLTGMSTKNDLQTLMVDIGMIRNTRQDEEDALKELEDRLKRQLPQNTSHSKLPPISSVTPNSMETVSGQASSLFNSSSIEDDSESQNIDPNSSNRNRRSRPSILQIDRLPSLTATENKTANAEAPPTSTSPKKDSVDMTLRLNHLSQSDAARMKVLELYGMDFHGTKDKHKHLMDPARRLSSTAALMQSGNLLSNRGPGPGLMGMGQGGLKPPGPGVFGAYGMAHAMGPHGLRGSSNRGSVSTGLHSAHRANDGRVGNLPPIQQGSRKESNGTQQHPSRLQPPPGATMYRPNRAGGRLSTTEGDGSHNEGAGASAIEAVQVHGWTPDHDQFEWSNINVLLSAKYRESFSDIIWSQKDNPPS